MKAVITITALLLCLVGPSFQQNTSSYVAGVVEYSGNDTTDHNDAFRINTEAYLELLNSPRGLECQIVVFPESTLNSDQSAVDIPRQEERIIPCNNITYHENIRNISCAAQQNRQYIVVNLVTRRNCEEEAAENHDDRPCGGVWNLYNTNVVFDTNGMVISTYRKFNLHDDTPFNTTLTPDISTFTTNFGVTFGHMIGSDILFNSPAMDLVRLNVSNFVYPTRMSSELPFLTAVQIQEGWAITNNVNILAAGANQPGEGRSGSGIYSGNSGALQTFVTGAELLPLIITDEVPNIPRPLPDSIVNQHIGIDLHSLLLIDSAITADSFEHEFIDTANNTMHNIQVCQESNVNELCCNFQIQTTLRVVPEPANPYFYIAAAFNGFRTFGDAEEESYLRICTILACTTNNVSSCGTVRPTQIVRENNFNFTIINIAAEGVGRSLENRKDIAMPNTLVTSMLTLPRVYFNYTEISADNDWQFSTANMNLFGGERNDILTFGIYVRDFTYSSAVKHYASVGLMTLIVSLIFFFK